MKKLLIFIILSMSLSAGEHESSTGGITPEEYLSTLSLGIVFSPLISAYGLAEQSIGSSEADRVRNQYAQFEKLMAQENIKAKDIFTDEQIQYFVLEPEDAILFDKTMLGILVSSNKGTLFIVPAEAKYTGISDRNMR